MLLIINGAPAPEIFDLHTAGIWLLKWLNVVTIVNFCDLKLHSQFPLTKHKVLMELQPTRGQFCVIYILNDRFITAQDSVSQSVTALLQLSIE